MIDNKPATQKIKIYTFLLKYEFYFINTKVIHFVWSVEIKNEFYIFMKPPIESNTNWTKVLTLIRDLPFTDENY